MITLLSIIIRLIAIALMAFIVLPKQWREAQVPNGLGKLRRLIFSGLVLFELLLIGMLTLIIDRVQDGNLTSLSEYIFLLNSVTDLAIVLVLIVLYRFNFRSIEKH